VKVAQIELWEPSKYHNMLELITAIVLALNS
jgi:hypothetical protein